MLTIFFASPAITSAQSISQPTATIAQTNNVLANSLSVLSVGASEEMYDITLTGKVDYAAGATHDLGTITLKAAKGGSTSVVIERPSEKLKEMRTHPDEGASGSWSDNRGSHLVASQNLMIEPYWFEPELLLKAYIKTNSWQPQRDISDTQHGPSRRRITMARQMPGNQPQFDALTRQSSTEIALDPDTLWPRELTFKEQYPSVRPTTATLHITYDDFQLVEGHLIPFHIRRYLNGSLVLDIKISTVKINTGLIAQDFQL